MFTFDEFRRLLTKGWDPNGEMCFADWLIEKFSSKTMLLGALKPSVSII